MSNTPPLSPYEKARLAKIQRNKERMESLGLGDAKQRLRRGARGDGPPRRKRPPATPSRSVKTLRSGAVVTPDRARASRRLKRKPVQFEPLMDDDVDARIARKRFKEVKRATKGVANLNFKCEIPADLAASSLTKAQKSLLEKKMGGDFLGKFEDYLTEVDTISDQNRRNVLRQVAKLAAGEGIRYESKAYGWPEGCYFAAGTKVRPTDDIPKLMRIGQDCEDEWGRDHGNGWLLSHPLKKLYQFQQYHLRG